MHNSHPTLLGLALISLLPACGESGDSAEGSPSGRPALARVRAPVVFELNEGQADKDVLFVHRASWGGLAVAEGGLALDLRAPVERGPDGSALPARASDARVRLIPVGGSLSRSRGHDELRARGHVYDGATGGRTRTDLPLFAGVRAEGVWPDVALELGDERGRLAYRIELGANADLARVEWAVEGAQSLALDEQGALRVRVEHGELVLGAPRFLARGAGPETRALAGAYRVDGTRFSFACEERAPGESLLIDPTIGFASFPDFVEGFANVIDAHVAVEGSDLVYVCTVINDAEAGEPDYEADALVQGFDVSDLAAPALLFQTFFDDVATMQDMAAGGGRLLVGGDTLAQSLPLLAGGYQTSGVDGAIKIVLLALDPTSGSLEHATYLGEPNQQPGFRTHYRLGGLALALDAGELVVGVGGAVGVRDESGLSSALPPFAYSGPEGQSPTPFAGGSQDACFATFSGDLSTLASLAFFGGTGYDRLTALDATSDAFVGVGEVDSTTFPTTPGAFQTEIGAGLQLGEEGVFEPDVCVMRFAADGTLDWSTLLGGPGKDVWPDLAVTAGGEPVVSFRVLPTNLSGLGFEVYARLDAAGAQLVHATPLPSDVAALVNRGGRGILPGGDGTPVVALSLFEDGPSVSPDAFDDDYGGANEVLYAHLDAGGAIAYSSFLGGSNLDLALDLAVGADGGVWISGETVSHDFPATVGAPVADTFQGSDIFLVKIVGDAFDVALAKSDDADPVATGGLVYFTLQATNTGDEPTPPSMLVDDLPPGWSLAFLPAGWSDDGGSVTIPVPALAPGASFVATLTAEAPLTPGNYTNGLAWVSAGLVHAETQETTTVLDVGDIPELLVTIEGPLTSPPEQQQLYRLHVRNIGLGEAPDVVLGAETENIKDLRFDSALEPAAVVQPDSVSWAVGALPAAGEAALDLFATLGDQAGPALLTSRATTSLLPDTVSEAAHTTTISGIDADLALTALASEVSGDLTLYPLLVSEAGGASASVGALNVLVEFTAELSNDELQHTRLVAPGLQQKAIPQSIDAAEDAWVLSINPSPVVGVPQTVFVEAPSTVVFTSLTARVFAPAVSDPNPANDVVSLP